MSTKTTNKASATPRSAAASTKRITKLGGAKSKNMPFLPNKRHVIRSSLKVSKVTVRRQPQKNRPEAA